MTTSTLSFRKRRWIVIFNSRKYADPIAWSVFFLLTVGFCALYVYNQKGFSTSGFLDVFQTILIDSFIYTTIIMIPVYLNLIFFKKQILDLKLLRIWTYTLYLFAVILNAILFAWLIYLLPLEYPKFFKQLNVLEVNAVILFGIQLISTGIIDRRTAYDRLRALRRAEFRLERVLGKVQQVSSTETSLKVGTKKYYRIILFEEINYLQGDGNEPLIFKTNEEKVRGSKRLKDYKENLPCHEFIQVHKSYIVAKAQVRMRKNNALILKNGAEIPIGRTFEAIVEQDPEIGFLLR